MLSAFQGKGYTHCGVFVHVLGADPSSCSVRVCMYVCVFMASGPGGRPLTMFSACFCVAGDNSFASHRCPPPHGPEFRRQPYHAQQRSVTFDLYPTTFSPRGSGRLTTFPTSQLGDSAADHPRHNMTSFSSFSPLPRQGAVPNAAAASRASPSSSSSTSSSLPPSRRHHPGSMRNNRGGREAERDSSLPLPHPASSSHYGDGEDGSYVDLKRQQQRRRADGDYMDMTGATYVPTSQLSVGTSGTWDGETTTSGSYTVDPQELTEEIDKLFFETPKDVVV